MSDFILMPKLMQFNFNIEMMMAGITRDKGDKIIVEGSWNSERDLGAMIWECEDTSSHPHFRYPTVRDLSKLVSLFAGSENAFYRPSNSRHHPILAPELVLSEEI